MKKKFLWIILSGILVITLVTGILMMGREVSVTVDGSTTRVHTYALTVRQLLRQMGYRLTDADIVTPSAASWLAKVDTVTLDRARDISLWVGPAGTVMEFNSPVKTPRQLLELAGIKPAEEDRIKINGMFYGMDDEMPATNSIVLQYLPAIPVSVNLDATNTMLRSAASTLGKALWEGGIFVSGADALSLPFMSELTSAREVTLTKATPISVTVDGMTLKSLSAAASVGQALQASGITLQNLDYSIPAEEDPLPADGAIRVVRVREEVQVQQESIPYDVDYTVDDSLGLDEKKVITAGKYGTQITRAIIRYEDGVETSREVEETTTLVEPVNEVIAYGAKISLNTISTEYGTLTYYRTESVYVTSYSPCRIAAVDGTACNSTTASGAQLQKGIIATTVAWYRYFQGSQIYIPGYGIGTVEDTGGGIPGRYWIDLGYSDSDWVSWSSWVTVYFLTPAPANVPVVLP
jgi:uncharacterized protein YabE (DUF348 family)